MGLANVERLPINLVWHNIESWLNKKGNGSENTKRAYQKDVSDFFQYIVGKNITQITPKDLDITYSQLEQYQIHLTKSNSNTTVNRKISAVKSLFKRLKKDYPEINIENFDVERLQDNTKESQVKSYGVLNMNEVFELAEAIKEDNKGLEKSLLFLLAAGTSFRLSELLSLKWDNISKHEDVYLITTTTKGGNSRKSPIHAIMYEQLLQLKETNKEYIFTIHDKTANRAVRKACELVGINHAKRNIKFHSFRKVGGDFVYYRNNKDIKLSQQQTGHKNINILVDRYMELDKNYHLFAGVQMFEQPKVDVLEELSKEELIEIIKQCDMNTQYEIINKIKK